MLFALAAFLFCGCGYYYTVEKGDTIYSISKKYEIDQDVLMAVNKVKDPRKLKVGQKLRIPRGEEVGLVKSRLSPAGKGADSTQSAVDRIKNKTHPTPPPKPPINFLWPAKGTLLRGFGKGADGIINDGLDIGAPDGAPVVAAADGEVILSSDEYPAYGNLVVIKHDNDFVTLYAHNRRNLVKKGMKVVKGQQIAEIGDTGRVKTPMLHFEIRKVSTPVDPLKYLPPQY